MATFYSSFFSSGLLAHHPSIKSVPRSPEGPSPMTTPRAQHASLRPDNMDVENENDTTPTAHSTTNTSNYSHPSGGQTNSDLLPSITIGSHPPSNSSSQPRLRRRRSSLTIATSPVASFKSSTAVRSAAASIQRQTLLSARARSGSDASVLSTTTTSSADSIHGTSRHPSEAPKSGSGGSTFVGRLRSGSLGTALRSVIHFKYLSALSITYVCTIDTDIPQRTLHRPRRILSRKSTNPPPALPPPRTPLPALPLISISASATKAPPTTPRRRPLATRSLTVDNYNYLSITSLSASGDKHDNIDSDLDSEFDVSSAIPSSPGYAPALPENRRSTKMMMKMSIDYPSPIGSSKILSSRAPLYRGGDIDMDMEN